MVKRAALFLNILAFFGFVALLAANFCFPEVLEHYGLRGDAGKVILLQIVSLMLLLGGFQASLGPAFRRLALVASFVVLSEAMLVGILLPGLR